MTVSSTISKVSYSGDDSTVSFPIPFNFTSNADIVAVLADADGNETTWTITTDYTLTGAGGASGGTLTAFAAPSTGETLVIYRDPEIKQLVDYVENDPFSADTHEGALDKLTYICQALDEKVGRALLQPVTSSSSNVTFSTPDAGKVLLWNATGTAVTNGPDADQIASAQGYADDAEAARDASQAARQGAEAARDAALAAAAGLSSARLDALDRGLAAEAYRRAMGDLVSARGYFLNGWLDPLTDAGQVALTGMEFQSGDTGFIQPTPAGSGVGVQSAAIALGTRGTNLKGSITTFTVDTANTKGHFDATAHAGVRAGTYLFLVKDGANYYPAVSSVTGDGTAANSVAFVGTLPAGVYSVTGIYALATTEAAGTYMWQFNTTIGHAVNYAYAFDLPPFDSTYWTAITGASADAWTSRNPGGQVFGAVSFNGGAGYVMWTGSAWRGIVQNNAETWQYYNPGTSQWVNATINDKLVAFSEALTLTENWWSLTPFLTKGTTDVCAGGTAISGGDYAGYPAANAFDNNATTKWNTNVSGSGWIGYDFGATPRSIWKYTFHPEVAQYVTAWTFEAWNGSAWVVLDTRTQTLNLDQVYTFEVPLDKRGYYTKYRMNLTGREYVGCLEMELYDEPLGATNSLPNITQAQWAQTYGFQAGTTTSVRFMAALRTTDKALEPYVKSLTMNVNRTTANGTAEFNAFTAVDPDTGIAVFTMEAVDTLTVGVDLKAWLKRGSGAYQEITLHQGEQFDDAVFLYYGDVNMSAGTGDATQFKLTTHNNKELRVFMVENHFRSV